MLYDIEKKKLVDTSGLILATYCIRYPHAMPFWEIKCLILDYKLEKHMLFRKLGCSKCHNFGKMSGKNPQLCFSLDFLAVFFVYASRMLIYIYACQSVGDCLCRCVRAYAMNQSTKKTTPSVKSSVNREPFLVV